MSEAVGGRPPRLACIYSHTHWDREWYRTYHEFRVGLTRVVRQVLQVLEEDPAFEHFVLDGQAVLVEDHLEVCPEDEERLRRQVSRGALAVGPWYVLPDEFLVSAEATVRNLLLGHQVATRLGAVQKVGYLPDSFGHVAQLPQILRQAGIDSCVYTRGHGEEIDQLGHEYRWQAPDGSEVLALNQCGGYCNAGALGYEELWHAHTRREIRLERAVTQVRELFARLAALSRGDVYLLGNGCDHLPPQPELGPILAALRQAFPGTEFRHTSLAEYVEEVRRAGFAHARFSGELLGGKQQLIVSGVWSARMYLKQHNEEVQTWLAGLAEPLAAYADLCHGQGYPRGLLTSAWKLLLKNHPHDSICGCSTDEVHREMETRFAGARQTADELVRERMVRLAPTFAREPRGDASTVLCVANPLPRERTEVVRRVVVLQGDVDPRDLELEDQEGRPLELQVLRSWKARRGWGADLRTELVHDRQLEHLRGHLLAHPPPLEGEAGSGAVELDTFAELQWVVHGLPGVGHRLYRLRTQPGRSSEEGPPPGVTVAGSTLENELVSLELHPDGTFDLTDRRTRIRYPGLNLLEDAEDAGDEYDHAPAASPQSFTSAGLPGRVTALVEGGLSGWLEASTTWSLPARLTADRRGRSRERVACPLRIRVGLTRGSPLVQVELDLENRAHDHRLRALFPTPHRSDLLISEGHFLINHRSVQHPPGLGWVQPPSGTYPQQGFSLVRERGQGLAVLNRGLPEVAALVDPEGQLTIAVTLLRCVGWLSRGDLPTRGHQHAGPALPTPEAQCQGSRRFRYAVLPFSGDHLSADLEGHSQRYRRPPLMVQGVADQAIPGGPGLLQQSSTRTSVSALKLHEERRSLVVRLCNLSGEEVEETLTCARPVRAAWRCDLLEARQASLPVHDPHQLRVTLPPHRVITLELTVK